MQNAAYNPAGAIVGARLDLEGYERFDYAPFGGQISRSGLPGVGAPYRRASRRLFDSVDHALIGPPNGGQFPFGRHRDGMSSVVSEWQTLPARSLRSVSVWC